MPDRDTELLDMAAELFKQDIARRPCWSISRPGCGGAWPPPCRGGRRRRRRDRLLRRGSSRVRRSEREVSAELNAELGSFSADADADADADASTDGDTGSGAANRIGINGRDGQRPDLSLALMSHAQMVLVVGGPTRCCATGSAGGSRPWRNWPTTAGGSSASPELSHSC